MPQLSLTLSGQPVDLPADAAVALSYRANDLRNLDSRDPSFSESFTLPLTAQNVAVLGAPHSLDSQTITPYRLLPAVLTSPGGVVVLEGFAVLESSSEGFDVTLTNALGALFTQVGEKKLRELDLSKYDHALSYESVQATNSNDYTRGYTYPLVDTGALTNRDPTKGVAFDELPAAVYYHPLLQAIVADALPGYKVVGSLLAGDTYQRAVLPQATAYPQLRQSYLEPYRVLARFPEARTYRRQDGVKTPIQFTTVQHGQLFAGIYYSPPPHPVGLHIELTLPVRINRDNGVAQPVLVLLAEDGSTQQVLGSAFVEGTDRSTVKISAQVPYVAATSTMLVSVALGWNGLPNNATLTLLAGGKLTIQVLPRVYPGAPVHLDASLPDKSQADFLKLVCNQFNVIIQADPVFKTVRFDLFNDLERNRRKAVDWTDKLDLTTRPKLAYVLGEYGQRNTLDYGETPEAYEDELFLPSAPYDDEARGREVLLVPNETLPATAEAYASDLFLPLSHLAAGNQLAWLPFFTYKDGSPVTAFDANQRYDNSSGIIRYQAQFWRAKKVFAVNGYASNPPREGDDWFLLADDDVFTLDNEELESVALVAPYLPGDNPLLVRGAAGKSYAPAQALTREGLAFADLVPLYYPGLAKVLNRVQVLTVQVRLNALDIATLDFTIPVKLNLPHVQGYGQLRCLAYLNDIDQYQPGLPSAVTCTLLVLGLAVPGLAPPVSMPLLRAFVTEDADYYTLTEAEQYLLVE